MLTTVRIGAIEVTALFDGVEDLDDPDILDPLHGPSDNAWRPYHQLYPGVFASDGGWRLHVRGDLIKARGRTILFDTGVGVPPSPAMEWFRTPGRLMQSLAEVDVAADDVDTVVLSHVHDDHSGGTVTPDGEPAFPNARYVINRADVEWQRARAATTDEARSVWETLLAPIESRGLLDAIEGEYRVATGVRTHHLPGHTPGHQVVYVEEDGASLLLSGDAIMHPAQLQEPELAGGPDEDADAACAARRSLIDSLIDEDLVLAPAHFAEPFGHVISGPDGFIIWTPV